MEGLAAVPVFTGRACYLPNHLQSVGDLLWQQHAFCSPLRSSSKDFNACLESSVAELARKHPKGFVVRLHVLGDFFSTEYVNFWAEMLIKYPMMNVYGYTHRLLKSDIGKRIRWLNHALPSRWRVRFSDNWRAKFSACVVHPDSEYVPKKGKEIICPEQLGQVDKCVECGLCWAQEDRRIIFLEH